MTVDFCAFRQMSLLKASESTDWVPGLFRRHILTTLSNLAAEGQPIGAARCSNALCYLPSVVRPSQVLEAVLYCCWGSPDTLGFSFGLQPKFAAHSRTEERLYQQSSKSENRAGWKTVFAICVSDRPTGLPDTKWSPMRLSTRSSQNGSLECLLVTWVTLIRN